MVLPTRVDADGRSDDGRGRGWKKMARFLDESCLTAKAPEL